MSTTHDTTPPPGGAAPPAAARPRDMSQLGLAALLAVIGAYTVYDASTLEVGFGDPVGPRLFPYAIGAALLLLSVLLVIATFRGDVPEPDGGEDVDLTQNADWVTVTKLVAVFVFTIATVNLLGWALSGAVLFAGSAKFLGSRTPVRDVLVGLALSVGSWYAFYVGLGIPLTPGVLDGVL